jgi:hypothetical protein
MRAEAAATGPAWGRSWSCMMRGGEGEGGRGGGFGENAVPPEDAFRRHPLDRAAHASAGEALWRNALDRPAHCRRGNVEECHFVHRRRFSWAGPPCEHGLEGLACFFDTASTWWGVLPIVWGRRGQHNRAAELQLGVGRLGSVVVGKPGVGLCLQGLRPSAGSRNAGPPHGRPPHGTTMYQRQPGGQSPVWPARPSPVGGLQESGLLPGRCTRHRMGPWSTMRQWRQVGGSRGTCPVSLRFASFFHC